MVCSFVYLSHLYSYQMKLCHKWMYTYDKTELQPNITEIWYYICMQLLVMGYWYNWAYICYMVLMILLNCAV
jgi:hypothetical protein